MNLVLPSWIPNDSAVLQGRINEELKVLEKLNNKVAKIESKPSEPNPFTFCNPNPSRKLPYKLNISLLNTLIYSSEIRDYQIVDIKKEDDAEPPTVYISTPHEIHTFQIPITKNNPVINIPDINNPIKSFAISPVVNHLVVLFENNQVSPYNLRNHSWKAPINLQTDLEIHVMKRMNNRICFQCGDNTVVVIGDHTFEFSFMQTIGSNKIVESTFPVDQNVCYFLTTGSQLFIFDLETKALNSISLDVLTEHNIFISSISSQICGKFIYVYNEKTIIKYDNKFNWKYTFKYGTKLLYAESDFLYMIYNPAINHSDDPEIPEENEALNDKSHLVILSLSENRFFAVLSINNIDVVSFKVMFIKQGERLIIIQGSDNSISFWNLIFFPSEKDLHANAVKTSHIESVTITQQPIYQPSPIIPRHQSQQPQTAVLIQPPHMPAPIPNMMGPQLRTASAPTLISPQRRMKPNMMVQSSNQKPQMKSSIQQMPNPTPVIAMTPEMPMPVQYQGSPSPIRSFQSIPVAYAYPAQRMPMNGKTSPETKVTRQAYLISPPIPQYPTQRIIGFMPAQTHVASQPQMQAKIIPQSPPKHISAPASAVITQLPQMPYHPPQSQSTQQPQPQPLQPVPINSTTPLPEQTPKNDNTQ